MSKIPNKFHPHIIVSITEHLVRVQDVAAQYGVSRAVIYRVLQKHGVQLSGILLVNCAHCGKEFEAGRARLRRARKVYCKAAHYYAAIHNPTFISNRQGQRRARAAVAMFFHLRERHVVHHQDGNEGNNDPSNLMVFRDHADHMRWHRGGGQESGAIPLWRGDDNTYVFPDGDLFCAC